MGDNLNVKTKGGLSTVQKMEIEKEEGKEAYHVAVSFQDENKKELENIYLGTFPTYEQAEGRYEYEMIMLRGLINIGAQDVWSYGNE